MMGEFPHLQAPRLIVDWSILVSLSDILAIIFGITATGVGVAALLAQFAARGGRPRQSQLGLSHCVVNLWKHTKIDCFS